MMNGSKLLWVVLVAVIAFWTIIGVHATYTIASVGGVVAVWLTTIFAVVLLLVLAGKQINEQWLGVLIDNRNKYSLARLQIALWTVIVMSAYLVMAFARIAAVQRGDLTMDQALAITFPPELLLAMGISAASFAGSSLIKQSKTTKTMTIGAKSTPEAAEQHRDDAKAALEVAEADLVKTVQAEFDAKAKVAKAEAAVKAATAATDKEAAEQELAMAKAFQQVATQEKTAAVKVRDEKKKALEVAEQDVVAITEAQGRLHRNADPAEASWVDLFRGEEIGNYKLVDMSKVQMMFFTIVVIAVYAGGITTLLESELAKVTELNFPEFGDTLNALLGISHGTYLSVKAVDHG